MGKTHIVQGLYFLLITFEISNIYLSEFSEESPDPRFKICSFDFEKYLYNKALKENMVTGSLKTRELALVEDLDDYGPDKFFEIVHQSESTLIMKNKFKVILKQYLNYKQA